MEPLSLYLSVTDKAFEVVLVKEEKDQQKSVYYVSQTLKDAKTRYKEYEALLAGLALAKNLEVRKITIHSDSQLVVRQTLGDYTTKDETLL